MVNPERLPPLTYDELIESSKDASAGRWEYTPKVVLNNLIENDLILSGSVEGDFILATPFPTIPRVTLTFEENQHLMNKVFCILD